MSRTKSYTEEQMESCTQIIRELVSLRIFARTLGDDILNAIDDVDAQVEKKIKYLIKNRNVINCKNDFMCNDVLTEGDFAQLEELKEHVE